MPIVKIAIDGSLLSLDAEEYVKGCLAAEMPPDWHEEALKAQSKLIRSYGLARMAERGWLYPDQKDQVWNSAKRTDRTDAIVEMTRGIVGTHNGKVILTFYSSACGGTTTELDWHGQEVPYLRAVECPCGEEKNGHRRGMCQYGAKALAEQGKTCGEILEFYYKDIQWVGNYGGEMPSKLSFQVQKCGELRDPNHWVVRHVKEAGVWAVVLIDPDVLGAYNPFPGVYTMGRLVFKGDPDLTLIKRGAVGAREYVAMCAPRQDAAPWIQLWQAPNEPSTGDSENPNDLDPMKWLTEFTVELVHLNRHRGIDTAVGVFGTSHPSGPKANPLPTIERKWQIFGPACREAAVLALHEYGMDTLNPTPENEWHVGHYKRGVKVLQAAGFRVPPIWITEHGIDRGGGQTTDGWRVKLGGNEVEYMRQLAMCDADYSADPVIQIVTPFIWLDWNWPSFTIIETMSERTVVHIKTKGAYRPGAMPAPPPISTKLTDAEKARLREFFATAVPATLKDAIARGREFVGEVPPNLYVSWDPAMGRYEINKVHPQTWEHLDDKPL